MDSKVVELTSEEKRTLLQLARQGISDQFEQKKTTSFPVAGNLGLKLPCFVTITIRGRLRGCIGMLSTQNPLSQNVYENAIKAAFSDPRFSPLKPDEFMALKIEVSVLGPLRRLDSISKLRVGTQGLIVSHGGRRGVLLAQVATENGWTPEKFLRETCHKAGLAPENLSDYEIQFFDQIEFTE